MQSTDAEAGTFTGDDVIDWLTTPEARRFAARLVQHRRLPGGAAMVDDLLSESAVSVLRRMRSGTPFVVENPAAYGTRVIHSTVGRQVRGIDIPFPDGMELEDPSPGPLDPTHGDGARVQLEHLPPGQAWLTSAALTYLTVLMHPESVPDSLPRPKAGSGGDHARAWPALWLAGHRDIFGDADAATRRRRARYIAMVRNRVELAFTRLRLDGDEDA